MRQMFRGFQKLDDNEYKLRNSFGFGFINNQIVTEYITKFFKDKDIYSYEVEILHKYENRLIDYLWSFPEIKQIYGDRIILKDLI